MCRIDYVEDEGIWLREPSTRRARKDHRCMDCGRMISAGETYTYGCWKFYGEKPMVCKMCEQCVAAGRWLRVVCGGHLWPGVVEELQEHWDEEWDLRSLGLGRLLRYARQRKYNPAVPGLIEHNEWRHRDGSLVSIAEIDHWVDGALTRVPETARH